MALQLVDTIAEEFLVAEKAHNEGRIMQAIEGYNECLKKEPNSLPVLISLGDALKGMGNMDGALELFRKAYSVSPKEPIVMANLAIVLEEMKMTEEALSICESLISSGVTDKVILATAHFTIGNCLEKSGQRIAAMKEYEAVLQAMPNYLAVYNNIGALLVTQGRLMEARECFERALIMQPNHQETHCNHGLVTMALGSVLEGMKEFEWRLESPDSEIGGYMRAFPIPRWRGERIKGKTVMVHCEQGLGDTLFAARYIKQLTDRGAKVTFRVQRELVRVLSCLNSDDVTVVNYWEEPVMTDYQVSVLSIPTVTEDIGKTTEPYLKPDPALVEKWGQRLTLNGLTPVAMVWRGNPNFKHEKERGMDIETVVPILGIPGYKFFGVQKGIAAYQSVKYPQIESLHTEITDMADTAAILHHMKFLVSMDTSVAHLAGAIGKPVKMLVQKFPEWRLVGEQTKSEWYPDTTLYRQNKHKDWDSAVKKLMKDML
jgi:tetratricopeptide (TPR) repeat protein